VRPRAKSHVLSLLLISGVLGFPSAGVASASQTSPGATGGGAIGPSSTSPTSNGTSSGPGARVQSGNVRVQASGNGITIASRASALLRSQLRFSGDVANPGGAQIVEIERRGRQTGNSWVATTHGRVGPGGAFSAIWPANHIGQFAFRAVLESTRGAVSRATPSSPSLTITVYRPAIATIYGPGFWGQRTACGETLRHATLGVANRTLPCGTPVSLLWHGRTIVVPVIDRGPYANNADWDLTSATAAALGISGTETIGAVSLPR
jgi:rare lipoprotein A